jgi:hypothetical protein
LATLRHGRIFETTQASASLVVKAACFLHVYNTYSFLRIEIIGNELGRCRGLNALMNIHEMTCSSGILSSLYIVTSLENSTGLWVSLVRFDGDAATDHL